VCRSCGKLLARTINRRGLPPPRCGRLLLLVHGQLHSARLRLGYFALLTEKKIRRGVYKSVAD